MKLKSKIILIFSSAFLTNAVVVFFGTIFILDSLSSLMMTKQAESIALFLQHRIIASYNDSQQNDISIDAYFEDAKHIADESKAFDVISILLVKPDLVVEASYPAGEKGKNYSAHSDLRDAFVKKEIETVYEKVPDPKHLGADKTDIDVVAFFSLSNGETRVLELKLDFAQSVALVEAQYSWMEISAIASGLCILAILLFMLLYMLQKVVLIPLNKISSAMEQIGSGDLEVHLEQIGNDEFSLLSKSFNEMIYNLKEKLQLYKYLSKGTIEAVRENINGSSFHAAERKRVTIFFSDIRGFTAFSEIREPSDIIEVLNRILSTQAKIIRNYGGDIDKFVGDEVMAIFPSPEKAISASIEIQREITARFTEIESLTIGIGIFEGDVVQGDIGSDEVKDYTVIGDSVNTAARLQGLAKSGEILISESIAERDTVKKQFSLSERGILPLKGKKKETRVFNVELNQVELIK